MASIFVIYLDKDGVDANEIYKKLEDLKVTEVTEVKLTRGGGCDADIQLDYA